MLLYCLISEINSQYEIDYDIGVSVIDTYTHYVLHFLEGINKTSKVTMEDLVCSFVIELIFIYFATF